MNIIASLQLESRHDFPDVNGNLRLEGLSSVGTTGVSYFGCYIYIWYSIACCLINWEIQEIKFVY
jgi:hypothetical protein